MISIDEAVNIVLSAVQPLPSVMVPLEEAGGYVLVEAVQADMDVPSFDKSMMDGYTLAASSSGEGKEIPVVATLAAGDIRSDPIPPDHAVKIMTGAPVPPACDAVIPVEFTTEIGNGRVRLEKKVKRGENISFRGEEIKSGQEILICGTLIDAPVAAVLAEAGRSRVKVHRRPRVGILVTGTELVDPGLTPGPGKIRESNSYGIVAQCRSWGAIPVRLGQAGDDPTELKAAIEAGLEYDILAITGGVSMGDYDLVPDILRELGVEILFHKVAQKPAKPMLFGKRGSSIVFGLPGNPVSCFLGFELYAGPAIRRLAGEGDFETRWFEGVAAGDFKVKSDRAHIKAARVEYDGGKWIAHPVEWHGSADIYSVVSSNAFARFEQGRYTVPAGELVTFFFHRGKSNGA